MTYITATTDEVISLGRQGENEVVTVQFDVSGWAEEYGEGTFTLVHQRCMDGDGYERTITLDDETINWLITNVDVAYVGKGRLQLTYTVGTAVAKSVLYTTKVLPSLCASEDVPDTYKPWVERLEDYCDEAEEFAESAALSATQASAFVGAPLVAQTVSVMTDTTKIYVYTGSETGYTSGNWYYYNGTAWASGGVYNSIAVNISTNAEIDTAMYS